MVDPRTEQILGLLVDLALAEPGEKLVGSGTHDSLDEVMVELEILRERLRSDDHDAARYRQLLVESLAETIQGRLRSAYEELEAANEKLKSTQVQLVQREKLGAVAHVAGWVTHDLSQSLTCIKLIAQSRLRTMHAGPVATAELQQDLEQVVHFV